MSFEKVKKYWIIPVIIMASAVLLLCMKPDNKTDTMSMHAFSVGKADAFLISSSQGNVLIDTGEKSAADIILNYLSENGIESLDYMIITHFDKDHVGGAAKILNKIQVKNVLQSNCPKVSDEYDRYLSALAKNNILPMTVENSILFELGKMKFTVMGPGDRTFTLEDSNNSSLITSVQFEECSFLFMGDSKDERIQDFLNTGVTHYDFLQIPHHGEYSSLLKPLLSHCTSQYAVITCSDAQPEEGKTVKLLEENNVEVYLTRKGAVTLISDGKNITVSSDQ